MSGLKMLESFLAQILSDVYRRPRMLLHLTIVFIALILLEYTGIHLPLSIVDAIGLGNIVSQERGVLIAVDLAIALTALFIYLALVAVLFSSINKALNKAFEHLDLKDSLSTINKLRNSCFVEDIVPADRSGKRRWGSLILLSLFSVAVILSYYLSITFFLFALNDWLSSMGIPLLSFLSSSKHIVFLTIVILILITATLMLVISLQWGLNTRDEGSKDVFEEWFEDLIHKYLSRNCIGKPGSVILTSLTPLVPKHRMPYLRYFPLVIQRSLAEAGFKRLVSSNNSQYSIENPKAFIDCIAKSLDMEKLKEGVFKNLCTDKLYMNVDKKKFLGILVAFTTPVTVSQKHPLRHLSGYRVIMPANHKEERTYIAILATDPSAAEFITRLITG
ncbi:MAG: hypothetical protein QXE01_03655 [Sulfolobales archaeon]